MGERPRAEKLMITRPKERRIPGRGENAEILLLERGMEAVCAIRRRENSCAEQSESHTQGERRMESDCTMKVFNSSVENRVEKNIPD
jgi:hypothetical protein